MSRDTYEALDNCKVIGTTEKAIRISWSEHGDIQTAWIPRSVCQDGSELDEGDTDIEVAHWFVTKEHLPV